MDTTTLLALTVALLIGVLLGSVLGALWVRSRSSTMAGLVDQAEVMQGLDTLGDRLIELDRARERWQGEFTEQVVGVQRATETLRRETGALSTALKRPQVRGRWGEMHLRRTVEAAGLVDRCDFTEQHQLADGSLRPDLVVHLAGGRSVVVDSKVPLDAFLSAAEAPSEEERHQHLARHADQLRRHVDQLGSKQYWKALDDAPEFVVLFVAGEAMLAAALDQDADLLERAARRSVVLAGPTTLIALLRVVAQGWRHEALAADAREIHQLGRVLHDRLGVMRTHLDSLGSRLNGAVEAYNGAVGSYESRVLVTGRRMADLAGYGDTETTLAAPRPVGTAARSLSLAQESGSTPARRASGT